MHGSNARETSDHCAADTPAGEATRLHAFVRGRVQGVGFRDYIWSEAIRLDCRGFVRNCRERTSLELVAEGSHAALEALVDAVRRGPSSARVDRVELTWETTSGSFTCFDIQL